MRRPALLAFGFFALAASLPAEIRECLPMSAACARLSAASGTRCERRAGPPACAREARRAAANCPLPGSAPQPANCRLHPTPDATATRPPSQVAAPEIIELALPIVLPLPEAETRDGWLEAPEARPRASPLAAPLAPRPPPLAV